MKITQAYDFVNYATQQALGETAVVTEDLSNIVSIGEAIFNANAMDRYVKALVNRIGKTIFVNRVYKGAAPSVMMDGWEYGSVLQKVSGGLPEATVNETWELQDGQSYDPHIFHKPVGVQAKFYNDYVTFEVDMSFTEDQLKASFNNATEMAGFISMLYTNVENSMTVKIDALIHRTINNMIGETVHDDFGGSALNSKSGMKAINLLYLYNNEVNTGTTLTADKALKDLDFIKFASYMIKLTHDRMATMSQVFNVGDQPRFTPSEDGKIVLLSDFSRAADVYLQSDTFHNELTKLPTAENVVYWQGSGQSFSFDEVSKIDIKTTSGDPIVVTGILGVMFDRWALGVSNVNRKVTSQWTPNAEFFTNFYKYKAGFFNDLNENFVVFFIA
jgi:hypothetical protein